MSELPDDNMERDDRLAALYQAAVTGTEPSRPLDDTIRGAAHRAVSGPQRTAGWTAVRSWRVPLSIAAVVVLSVSLVTLVREQRPALVQTSVDAMQRERPAVTAVSPKAKDTDNSKIATVPAKKQPALPLMESPATPPPLMQRQLAPAQTFPSRVTDRRDEANTPTAEMPAAKLAPTPQSLTTGSDNGVSVAGALSKPAAPALFGVVGGADKHAPQQNDRATLTPDLWLKRIEELRQRGEFAEAKAEFVEFNKHYPDYPLPPALKSWRHP